MSEADGQEKTLDASDQKLRQAREDGNVAVSREGATAGVYLASLLGIVLFGPDMLRGMGDLMLPLIDMPEAFVDTTGDGLQAAVRSAMLAMGIVLVPFFVLATMGALVPYVLQNSITVATKRIMPKGSHLSPAKGVKRMFGHMALFEFGKSLVKMIAIGLTCWAVLHPLFADSVGLVSSDPASLLGHVRDALVAVLMVATIVATVIAGIDMPYQHWSYRHRLRMSLQEMRDEMRSTDGDPHVKMRQRRIRMSRAGNRMMQDVPGATVVVTNPTHLAIALRYERGRDPAPVVVAKGADLIALRIRAIAEENNVPVMENKPLARALHKAVEVGEVIPPEHFEMAAKVISVVLARAGKNGAPHPN